MLVYWILLMVPSVILFTRFGYEKKIWYLYVAFCVIVIGLRNEVGSDWFSYLRYSMEVKEYGLLGAMSLNDPGYMFLNWISDRMGLGIIGVNLVCGSLFMFGLTAYAQKQPFPWLAVTLAVPYLLCVVIMGYTRQGVAIGFFLLALSVLRPGREFLFFVIVIIGALFHKSAVLVLPLMFLAGEKVEWWKWVLYIVMVIISGFFLVFGTFESQWNRYIEREMQSSGALVRVLMNVIPVMFAWHFRHRLKEHYDDYRILWWMGILALASIPFVLNTESTTMIDRVVLYLTPLQIALWPRIVAMQRTMAMRSVMAFSLVLYSASILYVWLFYSAHAGSWFQYKMFGL